MGLSLHLQPGPCFISSRAHLSWLSPQPRLTLSSSTALVLCPTLVLLLVLSLTFLWSRVMWSLPPRLAKKLLLTPSPCLLSVTTARDLLMPPSWVEPPE